MIQFPYFRRNAFSLLPFDRGFTTDEISFQLVSWLAFDTISVVPAHYDHQVILSFDPAYNYGFDH